MEVDVNPVTVMTVDKLLVSEEKKSPNIVPLAKEPDGSIRKISESKEAIESFATLMTKLRREQLEDESKIECGEELLSEEDEIAKAPFSLFQLEHAVRDRKRKVFVGENMLCVFCAKKGHTREFCPLRPNEKPIGRQDTFVEALLNTPQVDVLRYSGLSLAEGRAKLEQLGSPLNAQNPWLSCTEPRKQLRRNLGFWKAMGANKTVMSWIGYGVPLRFAAEPKRLTFPNHHSYYQHVEFVDEEIKKHVEDGSFRIVSSFQAKAVHPIKIAPKGEVGLRMCVDTRYINFHLASPKFQLETLQKNAPDVIVRGNEQFTTDLRKAYYAIEMDEEACPYLCWQHKDKFYMSCVLVFGLNLAPVIFHKIMREIVRFLRTLGINVLNYMDDFLWNESKEKMNALIEFVRWLLPRLGFGFNDKCVWTPQKAVLFLGLIVDAETYQFRVPDDKIQRVSAVLSIMRARAEQNQEISVDDLRVLNGRMTSLILAIEPIRVWTRSLHEETRLRTERLIKLSPEAVAELKFWSTIEKRNGKAIAHPLHTLTANVDASETGWGIHVSGVEKAGFLPVELIGTSSTRRELAGLRLAADSVKHILRAHRVRFRMDSHPAIQNLTKGGGPKPDLCDEVKHWWSWCELHEVQPTYEWVPREENKAADKLSKSLERKWTLRNATRQFLLSKWACPPLHLVTQIVDPEFNAIGHAIREAQKECKRIILVFPGWPAQSWWLEIGKYALEMIEIGTADFVFESIQKYQRIGANTPDWKFFAALLDFRIHLTTPGCA